MKREIYFAGFAAMIAILLSCSSGRQKGSDTTTTSEPIGKETINLNVDLEKSSVNWKGEMLGLYSHFGTVSIKSADLTLSGGEVSGGSFVINLNTITPTDENYSEDRPRRKLIGHLFSDDFFDLANYPTASFEIIESSGSEVKGMMTIRGNTHPETFKGITITREGDIYRIMGKAIVDRKKYNVSFDTTLPDRVISDDFELEIDLVAS